jgi:3-oxoacyl-(acyl-carrier-protein) synthase
VLCDDKLALELGADIHGAVPDVFVNADGFKKSISSPGPGNYITLSKAVAAMRSLLGEDAVRTRSFIQAHGSSTPQNRVTESKILVLVKNLALKCQKQYKVTECITPMFHCLRANIFLKLESMF